MINIDALNDDEKLAALESIHKSIAESKEIQKKKITTNVELIVKALKKIESDLKQRYDETGQLIANLKNGEDGRDGKDGKDGKNGRDGRDGPVGPRGYDGLPGRNGIDGTDGVSVTDAHIDFDGSLIISLSSGRVINVGEVVAADIAEKIKVITNGGGTSQGVLDAIASLQAQISAIVSGLSYKGTWNASTNTPTLTSSVGTAGFYYIVSVAGSTNLNGITDWQVGDWAVFSGTVWQKLDQTNLVTSVAGRTGAVVLSNTDISGLGTMSTQAANNVSITGGSITGITDLAIADGGTGASTAANARTNLGASTVGANVFTLTNPSAITFPRFNADNTVSALDAATFRTAIGAGTSSTTGTVTSVAASVPTFLSIGGSPITSSGTLAITLSGTALPTTSGGTGLTSFTANGVVYASSTSALTTGSSLTFDGSTFISKSNAEFGNSLVDANRFVNVIGAGTNRDFGIQFTGSRVLWQNTGQSGLLFGVSDAEQMRLTSTGLGIGTSSPQQKLHVSGGRIRMSSDNANGGDIAVDNTGLAFSTLGTTQPIVFLRNNFATESARIDSSGRFGIGVTPSAFSGAKVMQINGSTFAGDDTIWRTRVLVNAYNDGSYRYLQNNYAQMYVQNSSSGDHAWHISASGTAGNVVTFTQAMTLDATGKLLIGATSGGSGKLYVNAGSGRSIDATGTSVVLASNSAAHTLFIGDNNFAYFQLYTPASPTYLAFQYNSSEKMRLTSDGNLGIGTSSPAEKLHVAGSVRIVETGTPSGVAGLQVSVNGTNARTIRMTDTDTSGKTFDFINRAQSTAGNFGFYDNTAGAYRYIIDSSGNFGIGVTPSAWGSGYKVLQIGNAGFMNSGDTTWFYNNSYFNGTNNIYSTTAAVTRYVQASGAHKWDIAASGTAGTSISFTQAMTLDADGDLGIGVTSPAVRLDVSGGSSADVISIRGRTSDNFGLLSFATSAGVKNSYIGSNDSTFLTFYTNGFNERMRLDSSGNLGLGTTSPNNYGSTIKVFQASASDSGIIQVTGTTNSVTNEISTTGTVGQVGTRTNHVLAFKTNDTERARIDTSGNFGIGATSPAYKLDVRGTGYFSTASGTNQLTLGDSTNGTISAIATSNSNLIFYPNGSTERARIDSGGRFLVGTTTSPSVANVVVAPSGYLSREVTLTLNGTSTVTVPNGCICTMATDGFPGDSAIFSIKSAGGSQGVYVLAQGTAGNIGFGTTTNPSTGTRLNMWISAVNTMSIQDVGQGARTVRLTFTSIS